MLSHPNVVAIYDVGEAEGCVWLAMEHVHGVTLDAWLQESPRTTSELLEVMIAAGHGLEAAHEAGLVHRDFKPKYRQPSPEHPQRADRPQSHENGCSGAGLM